MIAMTGQFASLDEDLTGRENLNLLARLMGGFRGKSRARADELLAAFDLSDAAHKQVKNYSGGMRRRLDIAALAGRDAGRAVPSTSRPTGLDPKARKDVWKMIRALADFGRHDPTDHAISRGSRPVGRPHRGDRSWQEDRRGHQPRAQGRHRGRASSMSHLPIRPRSMPPRPCWNSGLAVRSSAARKGAELSVLADTAREANEALAALVAAGIGLSDFTRWDSRASMKCSSR